MTNNSALVYNLFGNQTASYAISGSGSLTTIGASALTLGGANIYSGGTEISSGTLVGCRQYRIGHGRGRLTPSRLPRWPSE